MKRKSLLLLLVLVFSTAVFAQNSKVKIPLNAAENSFKVLNKNSQKLTVETSMSAIYLSQKETKGGGFTLLEANGLIKTFDAGNPDLPVISKLIEVPQDAKVVFKVISYDEKIIRLSDYGITNKIMPAQYSLFKNEDPSKIPFEYNEATYGKNEFLAKEIAIYEESGMMRASRIGRIQINPIFYNPVQNTIKVLNNLVIEISFVGSNDAKTQALKQKYASPLYDGIMQSSVLNYEKSVKELITQIPLEYVIVADRMFEAQLEPFIEWKEFKGFNVTVGYTDEIGATTAAIKTWLQELYEGDNPPSFILFVGDVQQIPAWAGTTNSHVTDLYYCEYTGDFLPEVYYGRFSAQTTAQLQPQIDKTLMYEQYTMSDPSYLSEVFLVAGDDSGHEMTWGNGQIWYGDNYYFNEENGINAHTYFQPLDNNAVSAIIVEDMNAGLAFANYTAHCGPSGWSTPSFSTSDVQGLTNDEKYGLWIGNCCLSVKFDENECFGEAALRKANGGAIGDIGGSNSTQWDEDYWWGVGLTSTIDAEPTYEASGRGAYDGIFHNLANEQGDITTWMPAQGQIVQCGDLAVEASTSSSKNYYWEIYHLMGDPSLVNYLGVPEEIAYTLSPDVLMIGSSSTEISTVPYAYIAVHQNDERIAVAMADENGDATLEFSTAITGGDVSLVITAQNKQPLNETVIPIAASEPYILVSAYTPENANYNSTAMIGVDFQNVANAGFDATNVEAVLTTSDEYITIIDGTETVGSVTGGQTVSIADAFSFSVADNAPDQHEAEFTVTITGDDAKYEWTSSIDITVNAPEFEITGMTLTNDDNSNGRLDPGESADLVFTTNNVGHADAQSVEAHVEGDSPYLNIEDNTGIVAINAGETAEVTFSVSANEVTPQGTSVELDYGAVQGVYTSEFSDVLTIGQPPEINIGTGSTPSDNYPFYTYYENNLTQMLFHADEIGAGEKLIQELALDFSTIGSEATVNNLEILFLETTATEFGSSYEDMSGATQVFYVEGSYTMPTETGWHSFDIEDFTYSGSNNLIIQISWGDNGNWSSPAYAVNCTATSFASVAYGYADSETPPAYDGNNTNRPNVTLFIEGEASGDEYPVNFTVIDGSNSPIENATVIIGSLYNATDVNGETSLNLIEGNYSYTVYADGYGTVESEFTVDSEEDITIALALGSVNKLANSIKIYPNPSNGTFLINSIGLNKELNVEIYNISGQMIYQNISNDEIINVDMNNAAKGVYLIRITSGANIFNSKIILK